MYLAPYLLLLLPQQPATLVRVIGEAGKGVAGARVLFVTSPLPALAPHLRTRIVEGRTDVRGRLRQRLDPGLHWCAWAVHDVGTERFASIPHVGIVPGRPLRLELLPFGVPNVSWPGLDAWRKELGKDLALAFLGDSLDNWVGFADTFEPYDGPRPEYGPQAAGFVPALFRRGLPGKDTDVLRLPPLPLGFHYPVLTDGRGGFLDGVWMMHEFSSNPRNPGLYDRERRLKKVAPSTVERRVVRILDPEGKPIHGARLVFRPERHQLLLEREYRTDPSGEVRILMPARRDWQNGTALAVAPGHVPAHVRVSRSRTDARVQTLARSTELDWRLEDHEGLRPGDLILTTEGRSLPIAWDAEGRLELPSPPGDLLVFSERPHTTWTLTLLRGPRAVPLYLHGSEAVPRKLELGLGALGRVEVLVLSAGGAPVSGGFVELHAGSDQAPHGGPHFALDRHGRSRIELLPGRYKLLAWNRRHGDGLVEFAVEPGKTATCKLTLEAFTTVQGRVVSPDNEALPGIALQAVCQGVATPFPLASTLIGFSRRRLVTDASGAFEIAVSSRAAEVRFLARSIRDGRTLTGSATTRIGSPETVRVVVR